MIQCQFENGNKASLRHVTVNAIVIKEGKILLGKRAATPGKVIMEEGKWALLGGFMDRDETLEQAIIREVREESGWNIQNIRLFRVKDNPQRPAEDRQNVEFIFFVEAKNRSSEPDTEMSKLQWFSLDDLPSKERIAFDHGDDLMFYKQYVQEQVSIPIIGKK